MLRFLVRDLSVVLLTLILLLLQPVHPALQCLLGAGMGLVAYLSHEWGHYLGARYANARVNTAKSLFSPFLFSFNSQDNSTAQFVCMSWSGFAATGVYIVTYWLLLPDTLWGQIAWAIAAFLAAVTLVLELPLALWVLFRSDLPPIEIPIIGENRFVKWLQSKWPLSG